MPDPTKPLKKGDPTPKGNTTSVNNLGFIPDNYLEDIINKDMLIQKNNKLASQWATNHPNNVVQRPINNDKIDYPSTDIRSKDYSGNPNWSFAAPNMTGKQRADAESYHGDIIGGELLGLGAERLVNKAYGAYKGGNKTAKEFTSEIDWSKWNKEIPSNKVLLNEYKAIEQQAKDNGSWMKNPDGSKFQGTPEQFVQQNSENFKKAFGNSKLINPDGSPTIQYHGSAKKFDTFDESKFQLGDAGYSGSGIYTTPNKTKASSYSLSSKSIHKDGNLEPTIYELYGKGNNPISAEELIKQKKDYDLFNFHRAKDWQGDVPLERQMREYDVAIRNQTRGVERISPWNDADELVFPTNKQLKSAVGNNGMFDMTNPNIYKAVVPTAVGGTLLNSQKEESTLYKNGGIRNINNNNIGFLFNESFGIQ